jgi:cation:H+ antiporter
MTSIFIFISGATLLVYSAERLIGGLVGVSRGLAVSVFLLAIIFTGIEFDDIVLGIALNLEDEQDVALGLVIGTAVSFTGIVLALGAILTPTTFSIPREYVVVFALAPLVMVVFAVRKEVTTVDAIVLVILFVAWVVYVAVRESRRETATFRNLEIIEEAEELEEEEDEEAAAADPIRSQAVDTMSVFERQGRRWSGWLNVGLAVVAIAGIIIGASTVSTGTDQILDRYGIEGTVFGATIVTAVLSIEDLFLTARPIRRGVPEIGIGNVIGSLIFSVTGKLGIVVLAGGSVAIGSSVLKWHLPVLIGLTGLSAAFLWTGRLKGWHGIVLLGLYTAYWIVSFVVYGGAPVED